MSYIYGFEVASGSVGSILLGWSGYYFCCISLLPLVHMFGGGGEVRVSTVVSFRGIVLTNIKYASNFVSKVNTSSCGN